jgi:hypothetical protein
MSSLRPILRAAALLVVLGTVAWWGQQGAHRGWSQNRVPVSQTDEITGIAYTTYEDRFVPGIDVLAGSLAFATGLFVVTFFIRPNRNPPSPS